MTDNEETARGIIDESIRCNITMTKSKQLFFAVKNYDPIITDEECQNISKNYPFSWEGIRSCFQKYGVKL